MATTYEKTWSQRYTDEQGQIWQLVELEAYNGKVYETWEVIPQFEGPLPEVVKKREHDDDEPTGHDNNKVPEKKMPRTLPSVGSLSSVSKAA